MVAICDSCCSLTNSRYPWIILAVHLCHLQRKMVCFYPQWGMAKKPKTKNTSIFHQSPETCVTALNLLGRGFCLALRSVRAHGWKCLHWTAGYLWLCQFLLWAVWEAGFDKALWHEDLVQSAGLVPLEDKLIETSWRALGLDQLQNRKLLRE